MSGDQNYGGPAFPAAYWATPHSSAPNFEPGMILRDWFAGQALVGLIEFTAIRADNNENKTFALTISELAYVYADAMLAGREASTLQSTLTEADSLMKGLEP